MIWCYVMERLFFKNRCVIHVCAGGEFVKTESIYQMSRQKSIVEGPNCQTPKLLWPKLKVSKIYCRVHEL